MTTLRTLLISEDESFTRALLPRLTDELGGQVTHALSFRIALAEIRNGRYDCAIIDRAIGDGDGFALAPLIKRSNGKLVAIAITTTRRWVSQDALAALGYSAICQRSDSPDFIAATIAKAIHHPHKEADSPLKALTDREREILRDISVGLRNHEIAARYSIAESTIKSHCASIYRKLGVRNRVEAIALLRD